MAYNRYTCEKISKEFLNLCRTQNLVAAFAYLLQNKVLPCQQDLVERCTVATRPDDGDYMFHDAANRLLEDSVDDALQYLSTLHMETEEEQRDRLEFWRREKERREQEERHRREEEERLRREEERDEECRRWYEEEEARRRSALRSAPRSYAEVVRGTKP
jgi:hypothetical protein